MQRSIIELLKGNFVESLKLYPGLFPIMFTLIFLGFHLKNKYTNGAKILQYSYAVSAVIVLVSYIVKQVNHFHS